MLKRLIMALGIVLIMPAMLLAQHGPEGTQIPGTNNEPGQLTQHGEPGDVGHDQPDLLPDPTKRETWLQALWTVIIFLVLVAILYPTAWRSVLAGLKKREERIRKDIADAEEARRRAEETLRQYTQQLADAESRVRDMLSKAAADGDKLATTIRVQAQSEAEEIKERAQKDIESAKNAAIGEIYEAGADFATRVAEKIIRRELRPEDQQDLVRQSLEQLQSLSKA